MWNLIIFYHHHDYYPNPSQHLFLTGHWNSLLSCPLSFPLKCPSQLPLNDTIKCKSGQVTLLQVTQGLCLTQWDLNYLIWPTWSIHCISDLLSYDFSPYMLHQNSWLFLQCAMHAPTSGPLHLLFSLPEISLPCIFTCLNAPHLSA